MKVLILSWRDSRQEFDQVKTFEGALQSEGRVNEYSYGVYESLFFNYDGTTMTVTAGDYDLADYDVIFMTSWFKSRIYEDTALAASLYAASHGVKVVNGEVLSTRSRSKLSQYVHAVLNDISITPFMFCIDEAEFCRRIKQWRGGYPVIAKGVFASRGKDNYKLDSQEQLASTLSSSDESDGPWYIVQSFVPNEGDYRVIVMGDTVELVIHRRAEGGSHLNNASQGGDAILVPVADLPAGMADECVHLARAIKREVTGVDMICDSRTGKYYLLEINNMPQLATGVFVGEKMKVLDAYLQRAVQK